MKVLKDNSKKDISANPYPRKFVCEYCGSELEYEKSDLRVGVYGCIFLDCPVCGHENDFIDGEKEAIKLTKDNVEFPTHFYHVSTKTGAVNTCNNEHIKSCIQKGIDFFRKNPDEFSWFTSTGNTMVCVWNMANDEDYYILTTSDYHETFIPFESVDYKVE